jgi:hypothetical protein
VPGPVVRQAQVHGQVLPEAALLKAARGPAGLVLVAVLVRAEHDPVAACQDKALARGSGLGDQVAILLAAVRQLANSTTSSTLDPQPARLEPAVASEPALPDVRGLRRCQAARGGPAAQQLTSCKTVEHRSCRLAAQHSEARRLALDWAWHRSSRLAVRIVPASATDKLAPATDRPIRSRAPGVPERTWVGLELPMWADQELQT